MRHFSRKLGNDFFEDLEQYIASYSEMQSEKHNDAVELAFSAMDEFYERTEAFPPVYSTPIYNAPTESSRAAASVPMDISISEKEPSFCSNLFKIIDEKNIKDSSVYKKADIDRRLFSKIRSDENYHPAKNTAIRLCLALELDIVETEKLLESAGYCLSLSSTTDLVIRYCIEHKTYNIISVNEAIDYFSGKLI